MFIYPFQSKRNTGRNVEILVEIENLILKSTKVLLKTNESLPGITMS